MSQNLLVSVICTAYNHEKYIRKALESFVSQKTTFDYEVLVNDDASTDNTSSIIREYEERYPSIIRAFYQQSNMYSKGISVTRFLLSNARGKYFAICEGDDYWIDCDKLQKQVDFMEMHPQVSLCIHNWISVSEEGKMIEKHIISKQSDFLSTREVILGGGGFCATNSIMSRLCFVKNPPSFFNNLTLDYTMQIYFASCGDIYCFSDCMSAYRVGTTGSWSNRMRANIPEHVKMLNRINKMLNEYNEWSDGRYFREVESIVSDNNYEIAIESGNIQLLKTNEMKSWVKEQSFKRRIMIFILHLYPSLPYKIRTLIKRR